MYNAVSMRTRLRKWWPILKALLAIAILIAIGRQFAHALRIPERGLMPALRELWAGILHPTWLIPAGCLYLLGMGFSAVYWYRLLLGLGQQPSFVGAVRAHFIGQMGKYLPGKAWALFLRASEIRGPSVRMGIAIMTSFYDVLTTMTVGALVAAIFFALRIQAGEPNFSSNPMPCRATLCRGTKLFTWSCTSSAAPTSERRQIDSIQIEVP